MVAAGADTRRVLRSERAAGARPRRHGPALTCALRSAPNAWPTHIRADARSALSARPARACADTAEHRRMPCVPLQARGRRPPAPTLSAPKVPFVYVRVNAEFVQMRGLCTLARRR